MDKTKETINNSDSTSESSNNGKAKKSKKKRTTLSFAIEFFIRIGVTALVVCILLLFVVGVYINHSNSSYPMLKDGDLCLTYKLAKYALGDEIAYEQDGKIKFGRVVAKEGDIIDISEGTITVNGYGVYEDTVYPTTAEGASIAFPYTVSSGTLFVLNDYRDDVNDSRVYGGILEERTKGKVILVLRRRGI